jgi:hypothetical protein
MVLRCDVRRSYEDLEDLEDPTEKVAMRDFGQCAAAICPAAAIVVHAERRPIQGQDKETAAILAAVREALGGESKLAAISLSLPRDGHARFAATTSSRSSSRSRASFRTSTPQG